MMVVVVGLRVAVIVMYNGGVVPRRQRGRRLLRRAPRTEYRNTHPLRVRFQQVVVVVVVTMVVVVVTPIQLCSAFSQSVDHSVVVSSFTTTKVVGQSWLVGRRVVPILS